MANEEHVAILERGVEAWNAWRHQAPVLEPDLSGATLCGARLIGVNLSRAILHRANLYSANLSRAVLYRAFLVGATLTRTDLRGATLTKATLIGATLSGANADDAIFHEADLRRANLNVVHLCGADLHDADLRDATLRGANLRRAVLYDANLNRADLRGADLHDADLQGASLLHTRLESANLAGCRIYGISAWDVAIDAATQQQQLIITPYYQPSITVDNLEVAQFIYLLLNNEKLRHVIDTITSKVVLILGRFTDERKAVIDAIRAELRRRDFTPVVFDFDKPDSKDLTGTVETLARMARFIIADLTDPSSVPHELATIIPLLRTTPVLPLKLIGSRGYSMFPDLRVYPWVLPTHEYADGPSLMLALPDVIAPANKMADEYRRARP